MAHVFTGTYSDKTVSSTQPISNMSTLPDQNFSRRTTAIASFRLGHVKYQNVVEKENKNVLGNQL